MSLYELLKITPEYLSLVVEENPSLRGIIYGYVAERKLTDFFREDIRVTEVYKDDDHDRKLKGDLVVGYKGFDFRFEVKSLQTNSIKLTANEKTVPRIVKQGRKTIANPEYADWYKEHSSTGIFTGVAQCDASDRRIVTLPDGTEVSTTCLLAGEFDILAVCLFGYTHKWDFAFALNSELPRSTYRKYSEVAREVLLASSMKVTWPLSEPYTLDPFPLMDKLAERKDIGVSELPLLEN